MGASGEMERTVDATLALLGSIAETIAAHPHSTLTPRRAVSDERLEALLRELTEGDELRIEGTLGEGGMAVVYLAEQRSLGRKVAVKTLRPGHTSPLATHKLLREAMVTGALEHPNVLPVYDVHLDEQGAPRIVLKRIEGVPWSDLLHDAEAVHARFGAEDLLEHNLRILTQVCHAAHFAHRRAVVHRDLKPENVMIGEYGEVYLLDWGIAVSLSEEDEASSLELAGTPAYMAPEMLCPDIAPASVRTDVYLLGATLYEILCGRPPHDAPTSGEMIRSIIRSEPSFGDDAPEELVGIARRALRRDPGARYASAEELRLALQDFMQHRGSAGLAREAERRLARLAEVARRDCDAAHKRAELAELFGACCFGFVQALELWPENETARAGLARARAVMVEHEAEHGDPDAALVLLAEIDDPPSRLVEQVEAARQRKLVEAQRLDELERLGRFFDARAEMRARRLVTVGLALLGTVIPLVTVQLVPPRSASYGPSFILPSCFLAAAVGVAAWKRQALARTALNRWVMATVIVALAGQLLVVTGAALMQLPIVSAMAMVALIWSALASLLAVTLDRRISPVGLGYLLAFFAIAILVRTRHEATYVMSAAHLVTTLTVFLIWRPERKQP